MPRSIMPAPSRALSVLAAEMHKARSFPAISRTLLLGVLALLVAAVFVVSQASQFIAQGRADELGGMSTGDITLMLLHYGQTIPILLGAWVFGQDLPVGPRQTAFLATAQRGTLFVAKVLTAGIVALLAGILCVLAGIVPLSVTAGDQTGAFSLAPYGWMIGYWVTIAVVTAALVAATRSVTFTVVPIVIWTVGVSDLLATRIPALTGALDQAFKSAYLGAGAVPSSVALIAAGLQVMVALRVCAALYARRDVR